MTAPSQRDVVNLIQGQIIGFGKDIEYLKKQADSSDKKLDGLVESINNLAYVPLTEFQKLEVRVAKLEDYNAKNGLGVRFSNDIIGNLLKVVGLAAAAALIILATKYINAGGQ